MAQLPTLVRTPKSPSQLRRPRHHGLSRGWVGAAYFSRRAALIALAATLVPGRARAQQVVVLRVSGSPDDDVTPLIYAQQSGLFTHGGLDVQFSPTNGGSAVVAGVTSGDLQIAKANIIALVTARERGLLFDIISGAGMYLAEKPSFGLAVAANSPIQTAADLDGKTLGCATLKDLGMLATMAWTDQHGGDSSTIKFVEFPPAPAVGAIVEGRIAAETIPNPVLADAIQSSELRLLGNSGDGLGRRYCVSAWFCRHDYALANAETVRRFGTALRAAAAYTNAHQAETVPLLAALTKLPPDAIAKMTRAVTATTLDPALFQSVIDLGAKYKFFPATFPVTALFAR